MKLAGKNSLKNVNSLTLGDDKPKIDTGQKVSSNHHIGASPAQVSQLLFVQAKVGLTACSFGVCVHFVIYVP
jgi:hypothetical protein